MRCSAKSPKAFRRPGIERRARLLQAARDLLVHTDMTEIGLTDVAKAAGIPKGSAYFFYRDIEDLYLHLLSEIDAELLADLSRPLTGAVVSWQDIVRRLIMRGVRFYARLPAARRGTAPEPRLPSGRSCKGARRPASRRA